MYAISGNHPFYALRAGVLALRSGSSTPSNACGVPNGVEALSPAGCGCSANAVLRITTSSPDVVACAGDYGHQLKLNYPPNDGGLCDSANGWTLCSHAQVLAMSDCASVGDSEGLAEGFYVASISGTVGGTCKTDGTGWNDVWGCGKTCPQQTNPGQIILHGIFLEFSK